MEKYPYSMGSAVMYSLLLLATLWWLPILGPIIVGYITGRKAGGPFKGLVAMAIPVFLYFFVVHAIQVGWINIPPVMNAYLQTSILSSADALPYISYVVTTAKIAADVATEMSKYLYYAPPSFFIMFSFAFIGGAVSRQVILERGIYREARRKVAKVSPKVRKIEVPETKPKAKKVVVKHKEPAVKKHKKVKKFETPESSKFVVHPMDTKKNVAIKGRKVRVVVYEVEE